MSMDRICTQAYSQILFDAGPHRALVKEKLDAALRRAASMEERAARKGKKPTAEVKGPKRRRAGMTVEQARRMQAEAEAYDSRIVGGRLRDG